MGDGGKITRNHGEKRPFRNLETGETEMRYRGRPGYIPIDQDAGAHIVSYTKEKKNGSVRKVQNGDLVRAALKTMEALEIILRQLEDQSNA